MLRPFALKTLVSLVLLVSTPALADLDDVREELTRNIQTAQRELTAAQTSIGRERGELAQRLLAAQNRVLDLRGDGWPTKRR